MAIRKPYLNNTLAIHRFIRAKLRVLFGGRLFYYPLMTTGLLTGIKQFGFDRRQVLVLFALLIGGCSSYSVTEPLRQSDIVQLTAAIQDLNPRIAPSEAARAARIAYEYPRQLAVQYGVTDPPLIHNFKVNTGARPRGLCYQWADDLEVRLRLGNFQTLTLHRAMANAQNAILIEHSTVVISASGDNYQQGIVLDPWRKGGVLFWSPTLKDNKYKWLLRKDIFAQRRNRN